jgi:hypothetical protein
MAHKLNRDEAVVGYSAYPPDDMANKAIVSLEYQQHAAESTTPALLIVGNTLGTKLTGLGTRKSALRRS